MSPSAGGPAWLLLLPVVYLIWFFWSIRSTAAPAAPANGTSAVPTEARRYIRGVIGAGAVAMAVGVAQWPPADLLPFGLCVLVAAGASCCKLRLPGMVRTISTSFVVILFAAAELRWAEAMLVAAVAGVVQTYWNARTRPQTVRVLFNVSTVVLRASTACAAGRAGPRR